LYGFLAKCSRFPVKREQLNTGLLQEVRRLDRQIFIDLESHETALCGGKHHNTLFCQVAAYAMAARRASLEREG